jgi:hypothetical protein
VIEIYPNLFVGSQNDLIHADSGIGIVSPGWFVITAAKEPWHREALGYKTQGAPKDHPEYLIAERERRLILNLVDAPDPAYIREEIIERALDTIDVALDAGDKVLLHCNQGNSRAPTIALLWLRFRCAVTRPFLARMTFHDACEAMAERYPGFDPAGGMLGYARAAWEESSHG